MNNITYKIQASYDKLLHFDIQDLYRQILRTRWHLSYNLVPKNIVNYQ